MNIIKNMLEKDVSKNRRHAPGTRPRIGTTCWTCGGQARATSTFCSNDCARGYSDEVYDQGVQLKAERESFRDNQWWR